MKKSNYFAALFCSIVALVLFSSCAKTGEKTIEKLLVGSEIYIPEEFTGALLELDYNDTLVFISYDPQAVFETSILRNDTLIPTGYVCHKGGGPLEVTDASIFRGADSSLMVFAHASGIASLRKIDNMYDPSTWAVTNIDSIVSHLAWTRCNIVTMENGNILMVGTSTDDASNLFSIIDTKNGRYLPLDYWPDDGFEGRPYTKHRLYAENSRLFTNGNDKFVYCTGPNQNVFIFTVNGNHVNINKWIYNNPIDYHMADDGLNYKYNPDCKGLKMCATKERIYVLLIDSDITGKKAESFNESGFGNIIEVYDWDGNLQNRYELDKFIGAITLDCEDKNIIASTFDSESFTPKFIRYSLE